MKDKKFLFIKFSISLALFKMWLLFKKSELLSLTDDVKKNFNLGIEDARYVADQVRAIGRALEENVYPSAKGKGNKIRVMLKNVLARVRGSGDSGKLCEYFQESARDRMQNEVEKIESRFLKVENVFRSDLSNMNSSTFELDAYLNSILSGKEYHDRPKLLNEEYVRIAYAEGFTVPIIDTLNEKTLGKKYGLPLTLVRRLKSV